MKATFGSSGTIYITLETMEERIILERVHNLTENGKTITFVKDGNTFIAHPPAASFVERISSNNFGVTFTPEHVKNILDFLADGAKLGAVKYIKEVTGLGLKEAKELFDKFPVILNQQDLNKQYINVNRQLNNGGCVFTNHDLKTILAYLASGEKLMAVKYVKEVTGLGLKEANELVDDLPNVNRNRM